MPRSNPSLTTGRDSLDHYHLLFARDISLAQPSAPSQQNGRNARFCARIKNPIHFQNAKLNGIIISKQTFSQSIKSKDVPNAANCIWLDDSTAVLRVFFTERSSRRDDFHEMVIGSQVTLYGTVKRLESNENILLCSGFNVELDLVSEFSHWIKVIQQSVPQGAVDPLDDKEQRQTPAKSIFSTLSSQVTPTGHPSVDSKTPERGFIDSFSENSVWEGSPTHPIFTSTPLSTKKPQFGSSLNSPIYPQSIDPRISKEDEEEEKFEDDEIYGIDINDFE